MKHGCQRPWGRCGSAEGLDAGRHCLKKWGFRRCEDICWIKTNKEPARKYMLQQDPHPTLVHTKVPCPRRCRPCVRRSPCARAGIPLVAAHARQPAAGAGFGAGAKHIRRVTRVQASGAVAHRAGCRRRSTA